MALEEAKLSGIGARLGRNLGILACLLAVAAGCSGGSSDSADGQGGPLDGDAPGNSDEQPSSSTSSTTTTSITTTTMPPPPDLQDLADRLSSEIASGECSTAEQLAGDFDDDLIAAAVVDDTQADPADVGTICEELSRLDDWLSENDQRMHVGWDSPAGCDRSLGEVSLEAFPALFEAVGSTDFECLTISREDARLTYRSRGAFDLEPSALSSGLVHRFGFEADFFDGWDCSWQGRILIIGEVFLTYLDFKDCPLRQGFGPSDAGSPAPIIALTDCVAPECGGNPPETWFASDGFFWDRGWTPSAFIDTTKLTADLDVALSALDASLFAHGRFDASVNEPHLVTSMHPMMSEGQLSSPDMPWYGPFNLAGRPGQKWIPPSHYETWDELAAYRGGSHFYDDGRFSTCRDWTFDQLERGHGKQPCMKVILQVDQFDQRTGFCSFLAKISDDGQVQRSSQVDNLVWVDGFTPNVSGECLIDAKVDNDDIAYGHFVPSGTYTYLNSLGGEVTVPKLTALRVIEARDQ